MLVALPLTGLAAVSGVPKTEPSPCCLACRCRLSRAFPEENEFGDVHEILVWTTLALVMLHISAALYNQFVSSTNVADRMPPFAAPELARFRRQ